MVRSGDVRFLKHLGHGAFSSVELAENIHDGTKYAVKVVSKGLMGRDKKLYQAAMRERDILSKCRHPSIIRLVSTFQTTSDLCYVMEYAGGGELLDYIRKMGRFQMGVAVFITAEIVLALEYLHTQVKALHRDIKPENILLDANNHVKLIDFGTSILLSEVEAANQTECNDDLTGSFANTERDSNNSFCGTTHYMPPEMISNNVSSRGMDMWGLGCVVYFMLQGQRPFDDPSQYELMQKVLNKDRQLPFEEDITPAARSLITGLLDRDPAKRLGTEEVGGFAALKNHEFFSGVDFESLTSCELHYNWEKSQAPGWIKDHESNQCRKCNTDFTFFTRKHHCRKCGHVFCDKCTQGRCAIPQFNMLEPVRVCESCHKKIIEGRDEMPVSPRVTRTSSQPALNKSV